MRNVVTALVAILVTGCAGSPIWVLTQSPEELQYVALEDLCNANPYIMSQPRAPNIHNELRRRDIFSPEELRAVIDQRVFVGMTRRAATCALGPPNDINRTVTAVGEREQLVYRQIGYRRTRVYVYIEAGVVTGYQD